MAEVAATEDGGLFLAGLLSASEQLDSLDSLDAAFTADAVSASASHLGTTDPVCEPQNPLICFLSSNCRFIIGNDCSILCNLPSHKTANFVP